MNQQSEEKLTKFFQGYSLVKYQAQEIIYHPGEMIDRIAFIKKGFVRIYNYDQKGKEKTYSGFKPIFLMSYLFAREKIESQYYLQALTDLDVWKAPLKKFEEFLKLDPQLAIEIIGSSLRSLHRVLLAWDNLSSGDVYNRTGKLLLALAKDYGKTENGQVTIDFHTTHYLISTMLGASRETTSTQIKKMENNRLIDQLKNNIIIKDMAKMVLEFKPEVV